MHMHAEFQPIPSRGSVSRISDPYVYVYVVYVDVERRKSSDESESDVFEYLDLWFSGNTPTTGIPGFSDVKWVS